MSDIKKAEASTAAVSPQKKELVKQVQEAVPFKVSILEIHDQLFDLYTGNSPFIRSLSCTGCANFAFNPHQCQRCQRLTCKVCYNKKGICLYCTEVTTEMKSELNLREDHIISTAQFQCPENCGARSLSLVEINDHLQKHCPKMVALCPNECGMKKPIHKKDLKQHLDLCPREKIICKKCNESIERQDYQSHLHVCRGPKTCPHCQAPINYIRHTPDDCISYLMGELKQLDKDQKEHDEYMEQSLKENDDYRVSQPSMSSSLLKFKGGMPIPGTLRVTKMYGRERGKLFFVYPQDLRKIMKLGTSVSQYKHRVLKSISCMAYDTIASIQLGFTDGTQTPHFGNSMLEPAMKIQLEFPKNETVTGIMIRHSPETASIQNITFRTDNGSEVEINSRMNDGEITYIELEKNEKIVGVYGYQWSQTQPEIISIGFVIWKPQTNQNKVGDKKKHK